MATVHACLGRKAKPILPDPILPSKRRGQEPRMPQHISKDLAFSDRLDGPLPTSLHQSAILTNARFEIATKT